MGLLLNNKPMSSSTSSASASDLAVQVSSTGLRCSMEGFVNMVIEITELVLSVVTMFKEIIVPVLPENLGKSLKYAYMGLSGASSWLGYAVAAVYFIAKDKGFGSYLCEALGYGNVVVEALYTLIDFGASIDQSGAI